MVVAVESDNLRSYFSQEWGLLSGEKLRQKLMSGLSYPIDSSTDLGSHSPATDRALSIHEGHDQRKCSCLSIRRTFLTEHKKT